MTQKSPWVERKKWFVQQQFERMMDDDPLHNNWVPEYLCLLKRDVLPERGRRVNPKPTLEDYDEA